MIARESDSGTHTAVDGNCSPGSSFSSSFTYVKEESDSGIGLGGLGLNPEGGRSHGALWPEDPEA